jgi:hypothetical protein
MKSQKIKYDRDTILKDLQSNVVEVTFEKVNGETRVMRCTLDPQHLPSNFDPKYLEEHHEKPQNKNVLAVWDLQNGGWRAFRVDSVSYMQIIDGY